MEKTVVELFAGVGGFRVGLNDVVNFDEGGRAIEHGEWDFVFANQWEPSTQVQHAFTCYQARFGNHDNHSNEDITTVNLERIQDHSLLVGGFPCQDYSVARTKSGEQGIQGKKGVLFWEIVRIIHGKNTPFVLLENVDRLLCSPALQRGRDFGIMLRTFFDNGYNVEWRVINAAEYGCVQRRRRVFIFAWKRDLQYNQIVDNNSEEILFNAGLFARAFPINYDEDFQRNVNVINLNEYRDTVEMTSIFKGNFKNSGCMINGVVSSIKTTPNYNGEQSTLRDIRQEIGGLNAYFLNESQEEKFSYLKYKKRVLRTKPNGEEYYYSEGTMSYPDALDLPGRTMLTSESSVNRSTHIIEDFETHRKRFLTPVEAERMQGFPDSWTDTGMPIKKRYFMMGNALVTDIIKMLERYLYEIITNEP